MIKKLSWHQKLLLKKEIKMKCQSFHQLGYSSVDEAALLNYLLSYRWKHQGKQSIKAYKEDILLVQPNEFFDYQQLVAQTTKMQFNDWHDIEDLF